MKIVVRPLAEADIPAAARINRAAFSAFFGISDPARFRPGADVVGLRRRLWPEGAFAAELDGALAGSAVMMRWGSVCILGPVTVAPEHWSQGIARALMEKLVERIDAGKFRFAGLVTHPQSPKHVRLYESFGFRMQRITSVMSKAPAPAALPEDTALFSAQPHRDRPRSLSAITALTGELHPGFDIAPEVLDVAAHGLGETLLLFGKDGLDGFALCHYGRGSEASESQVLVKFAAANGGSDAAERFGRLLAACEALAAARGANVIVAGTNTGRAAAYEIMQAQGFRTTMNTIAMMRPAVDGYNRPDVFAIDDWR
jgi:GNAT superfamily N-acetyltransferase